MTAATWIIIIIIYGGWDTQRLVIPFPDKPSCEIAAAALAAQLGHAKECVQLGSAQ